LPHIEVWAGAHIPAPSQFAEAVSVDPTQLCMRQPVLFDHGRHAPAPLQVPSFMQLPAAGEVAVHRFLGSAVPEATGVHVPTLPVTLQLRQSPVVPDASLQAELQHTPSVQNPCVHSALPVQVWPSALSPHEPLTQVLGGTQSVALVAVVQLVLQAPVVHMNLSHVRSFGVLQAPLPLQVDMGVTELIDEQLESLHLAPLGHTAQAPPWHLPVVPHEAWAVAWQIACGSALPSLTAVQMPGLLDWLQATQAPVQAALQHTPWAQWLDWHSPALPQSAPFGFKPHEPLTQTWPGTQSGVSLVHADRHRVPPHAKGAQPRPGELTHWLWLLHVGAGV
jgi:hypothetical protein